jgi:hypothetical protein
MIVFCIAVLLWMLFGCTTTRKAFDIVGRPENSGKLSTLCADKYPVKDSVIVRDSISFDTIYVGSDPVFDTIRIGDTVRIIKTVEKVVTKTVTQVKEVYRENTARVVSLRKQVEGLSGAVDKAVGERDEWMDAAKQFKGQRNKAYMWWGVLVASCLVYIFRRQIFSILKFI